MINGQIICSALIGIVVTGCVVATLPDFEMRPEPPLEWSIQLDSKDGCPSVSGQFELIPKVADLQKDSSWHVSTGNWYDYLLLIPFSRTSAIEFIPGEIVTPSSHNSLLIEISEAQGTFRVVSPDKNNENFQTHVFSQAANDYTCQSGNLIFPEFKIHGGTEGSTLNGKTYRHLTVSSNGDLLFYEQTQSHKTIHKYYLFKSK